MIRDRTDGGIVMLCSAPGCRASYGDDSPADIDELALAAQAEGDGWICDDDGGTEALDYCPRHGPEEEP